MSHGKHGYRKLKSYIELNILPSLLRDSHFDGFSSRKQVSKISYAYP